jgi:hypothetical protein
MKYGITIVYSRVNRGLGFAALGAVAVACLGFLNTSSVEAGSRVKGQYATSKQPYWSVGKLNRRLSTACRRGRFLQRQIMTYSIGFVGEQGRGITGIANKYWNLKDTDGLAEPYVTYHFYNQGYSNCKVFVAKTPKKG